MDANDQDAGGGGGEAPVGGAATPGAGGDRSAGGGDRSAELLASAKDAAYTAVGFGVLGFQRLQVRRQELLRELRRQGRDLDLSGDSARRQLAALVKAVDETIAPLRGELEGRLDGLEGRLTGQVQDLVRTARSLARETEQQLRHAVGS